MPPFLNRDSERRRFNLTNLNTGYVRKRLWLHPDQVSSMNRSEILLNRCLQWLEEGQGDLFNLDPIDHDSFFTCTPQNKCRK